VLDSDVFVEQLTDILMTVGLCNDNAYTCLTAKVDLAGLTYN